MKRCVAVLALTVAAAGVAQEALAIPAFARRYQVGCFHCHDGYPKLSTFGQKFKERGFRMEQEDLFSFAKWIRTVPVIVRAEARRDFGEDQDGELYYTSLDGKIYTLARWTEKSAP